MNKISRMIVMAALSLIGCQTPSPYDPGMECPRLENCGQCASRGGCTWCGDTTDGSRGLCMAIGRSECGSPNVLSKTPDQCAPPPSGTPYAIPLPQAQVSSGASEVEKRIGSEKYKAIRNALARAFPGAPITDDLIGQVNDILSRMPPPKPGQEAVKSREKEPITRPVWEKEHRLYVADAVHHRVKSMEPENKPMQSKFTKAVAMVRVPLPATITAENNRIETEIGDVDLSNDHLLGSIDLIASKYSGPEYLGYRPARVDLLTPARSVGARFGAIAVYLGYRGAADKGPSFYMLEAGTATGDAKMIYFSPNMNPISNVTSYYVPTPFVTMRNTYSGGITMQPAPNEDEPRTLMVESRIPGEKDPYMIITANYVRAPKIDLPMPVELLVNAAARVAAVAQAMGVSSTEPLENVLVDLAKTFYWIDGPRYEDKPPVEERKPL